ncbi:MAG: glycoside hydrolase family 2 TIM barrel-domain containing protein [Dorea sp.]
MKKRFVKRLLSFAVIGALALTSISLPVQAEEGDTIAGEPETVLLTGSIQDTREADFNEGWKFYLGTSSNAQNSNFDDSSWKSVTLPHDFSISQSYTTSGEAESGFLPGGTGWYRKTFTLPESYAGKRLVINFDGVYSDAYVYVNGTQVGENHYGYTSFAIDITDKVTCDGSTENVIAVKAVNNIPSSRWYSGSGIYRDVTLITTNQVYVDYRGTQVTTPNIASGNGTVHIKADIVNALEASEDTTEENASQIKVKNTVYTKAGEKASETVENSVDVTPGNTQSIESDVVVTNPLLWSTENPNLYYVRTEVWVDDTLTDSYDTTFGFRYFNFDSSNGFQLNGENLKLNGVCLHHDQGALGSAASYDAMYRQLSIMKDMGVNAIRTSHNPADEDFIDICNELGLLVIEEAFDGWSVSKNGNSNDFAKYFNTNVESANLLGSDSNMTWAEFAVKSMVLRDRNDPSVILWSLGNEIQEGASADSSFPTIAQNLINWVNEEDTTRKTTIGSNQRTTSGTLGSVHSTITNNGGIVGFNYASGDELKSMSDTYGVILASETSSAVNSRGIYTSQASASNADGKYHLTSYDTSAVSWGMTAHDSLYNTMTRDYVAGEFVWTGFDYLGEPTPWNGTGSGSVSGSGAIPNSSYFGIVETTGFPKDTYYFYRSQWNQSENTLHLVTAWDSDNMLTSSGKTPVVIYSNAPKVELYRNDTLIGTATRTVNKTDAGYEYYTYSTTSNDSNVCTAVSASGSGSLYATFNVTYAAGTISAKAYDESGKQITDIAGNAVVSTPGTPSNLDVQVNKNAIDADGSSLAYISVEVEDANGNLDTTATNAINFSLTGNGEIVGVDNGDQATTDKYQQSSALTSTTSAQIAAYAGKALVIVRSTKDAGSFTVNVSSDGLTGGNATVTTNQVDDGEAEEGLVSYTMVRDYTIKAGTKPTFKTDATGTMADGKEVTGTVAWDEVAEETYNTPGDYVVKGALTFDGEEPLSVTCRLHVIGDVVALRNISTATMVNTVPTLPDQVAGVLADGSLCGEFTVDWEDVKTEDFATEDIIVVVDGIAKIFGDETLPVTASVRVAEAVNTESTNVAPAASSLTQDIASANQSDNLASINNGTTKPGDNTSERWSNWNNRTTSATAALTFKWDTAQLLSSVNLYYYYDSCAAKPESVAFEYSLDGTTYQSVGCTEELVETYSLGEEYTYTFEKAINPIALRIVLTQQNGTTGSNCVALTEAEIMTYAGKIEYQSSAALSGIFVDGTILSDFASDSYHYQADGTTVTAESNDNVGITILPNYANVIRILTISEDGSDTRTYEVELTGEAACEHSSTEITGAMAATCTENGYTGDTVCLDCGAVVKAGETIPATGHSVILVNQTDATCEAEGYTGDQQCTVCGAIVEKGTAIPATGHTYNSGVVTKEATETEEGIMLYTCSVCGATKTEVIPKIAVEKTAPKVTLSVAAASGGKIALTGKFEDYENVSKYYDVTAHGLIYYSSSKLGTRTLTVNTPGRTRVNFSKYQSDGSFTYSMTPASASTKYTVRAFLAYQDESGRTVYVYSSPKSVSYNSLN